MTAESLRAVARVLEPFMEEALPGGGIDVARSRWQHPGRGAGVGSDALPGRVDVRYLPFLVEALYRVEALTGNRAYGRVADAQVRFVAEGVSERSPSWALGNALEMVGAFWRAHPGDRSLVPAAWRVLGWLRRGAVEVVTLDGVRFRHLPCGYGHGQARDVGWTNDLSMAGSGLVRAYEVTGAPEALADAVSFAEYFLQPWRPGALGEDGYWRCGTWREDLGSWVIGPIHLSGFESTDLYGDEASWVFSTMTCIEFLVRLHAHHPDPRLIDRCLEAAAWTFDQCQFPDGGVGMCGRDDEWLGFTGDAVRQVGLLRPFLAGQPQRETHLLARARRAYDYLLPGLARARLEDHGVVWVNRTTSIDPLCNVAMLWVSAVLGLLAGADLFAPTPAPSP